MCVYMCVQSTHAHYTHTVRCHLSQHGGPFQTYFSCVCIDLVYRSVIGIANVVRDVIGLGFVDQTACLATLWLVAICV